MTINITSGRVLTATKTVIYGPEGIGKTTLASQWPQPLFLDTEDGTKHLDTPRVRITAWTELLDAVAHVDSNPTICDSLIIDTADAAERLAVAHVCAIHKKQGIEDFGFGKGYVYLAEEFAAFLHSLRAIADRGVHIVIVAHSTVKKLELPDADGAFDHYELKCSRTVSPLLKEYPDALLFLNYKVTVQTNEDGRTRAIGGKERLIHATHTAAHDAKNRWGLQPIIPAAFEHIAPHVAPREKLASLQPVPAVKTTPRPKHDDLDYSTPPPTAAKKPAPAPTPKPDQNAFNTELYDRMKADSVTAAELEAYLRKRNYITASQSLDNLPKTFVDAMLKKDNWTKITAAIAAERK